MSGSLLAAGVAVAAATLLGSSSVAQRRGMLPETLRSTTGDGLLSRMLTSRWWWAGTLASVGGLVLQFLALGLGSLVVVQTTMVSSIVAAGLAERVLLRRRPGRSGWTGMALTATGLIGVLTALAPTAGVTALPSTAVTTVLGAVGLVGLALAGLRARLRSGGALLLAAATGLGYGLTAVTLKIVGAQLASGWTVPFTHPALWLAVVLGPLSVLTSQHALHRAGRVAGVVSLIVVIDPVVGLLAGATLFGEQVATTLAAVTVASVSAVLLAAGVAISQRRSSAPDAPARPATRTPELVGI